METIGIFEAKAKLSEICEHVASSKEPMVVTRRGKPLVRILPLEDRPLSIVERRSLYLAAFGSEEVQEVDDFELPLRSRESSPFRLEG